MVRVWCWLTVVRARPSVLIARGLLSVALRALSSSKSAGQGGLWWRWCYVVRSARYVQCVWWVGDGRLSR